MTLRIHRRTAAVIAPLLGVAALMTAGAPSVQAAAALHTWTGVVTRGVDGDTTYIDIAGDGLGARSVRNAGIQAMEHTQCHFGSARDEMEALTLGKHVTLSAPSGVPDNMGRPVRFITVGSGSSAVDVQKVMLQQGFAIWLNLSGESNNGYEYRLTMEQAATQGQNLWDTSWCGSGPQQELTPQIWINYDGDGDDASAGLKGAGGEYARIYNPSTTESLDLTGWWLRDATLNPYVYFKSGTKIPPGGTMFVWTRKGTNNSTNYYFDRTDPMYHNPTSQTGDVGGGVYLFDPDGDLRSHADYPCVYQCTHPTLRVVKINADAPGSDAANVNGEYIQVENTGETDADMWRVVLQTGSHIYRYGFGNVLAPGQVITLHMGKGTNSALTKYVNSPTPFLTNTGGIVTLRTTEDVAITCASWGASSCNS